MSQGYFEFYKLNGLGDEVGLPIKCLTATAVVLQSHAQAVVVDILHLCEISRETADYPVDLTAWRLYEVEVNGAMHPQKALLWSARIYWRSKSNGQ